MWKRGRFTAGTYLSLRELEARIALAERTLAGREASLRLAQRRGQVGLASDLEVRQVEGLTAATRAELAGLRLAHAQTQNALRLLVGNPQAALPPGRSLDAQGVVLDLPAGVPAEVLIRRPDVRAAEQGLIAANADIGAARAAFFPRITLTGGAGYASRELDNLFGGDQQAWSFLPQVSLPIFQGGRLQSNLELARAREHTAVAQYEQAIQAAFREVADLLAARQHLADQLEALEAARQAQAARLMLANVRYNNGVTGYLDVLDAERELFAAEQAVVQTQSQLLGTGVGLYRALGGGLSSG